jgi:hypothetical protein
MPDNPHTPGNPDVHELILSAAVVRAVTSPHALRGLADSATIGTGASTSADGLDRRIAHATTAILGALAVTAPETNQKILNAACGVARTRRSVRGLEPIVLSALLGSAPGTPQEALAEETWQRYAAPDPEAFIPILNPTVHELLFATGSELSAIQVPQGLRNGLRTLLDRAGDPSLRGEPDVRKAETAVAASVILAGGAVASAYAGRSADRHSNRALPDHLTLGSALPVEVLLTRHDEALPTGKCPVPGLMWPELMVIGSANDLDALTAGPDWEGSRFCQATAAGGPALRSLVLRHGRTMTLAALPRLGPTGTLTEHGFLPRAPERTNGTQRPSPSDHRAPGRSGTVRVLRRRGSISRSGFRYYISYAPVLDPLTGAPWYYSLYPAGYEPMTPHGTTAPAPLVPIPGSGQPDPLTVIEYLEDTVRALEMSLDDSIGTVIQRSSESAFGRTLNRYVLADTRWVTP